MQNSESVLIHFGFKGSFQSFSAALEVGIRHFNADSLIAFLHSSQHGSTRPGKGVKDPIGAIWGTVGYTVLLCFMLFKTGTIARSIFSAH